MKALKLSTKSSTLMLTLTLILGLATATIANAGPSHPAMKVATIEQMYEQDASNQGQEYPVTLEQYGSQELQAAMMLERDYFNREQMSCHIGYDVLWNSQDPDYEQHKQFSMTDKGLVQVSLAHGSEVYYDLSCDDSACQVTDVILDEDGSSLMDYLIESCQ